MPRPTAITVIGVIGIVLGILGLCGNLFGLAAGPLAGTMQEMAPQGTQDPQLQLLSNPTVARMTMLQSIVGLLLGILLLVSAILLLKMSFLGYNLMIVYSVLSILWTLISLGTTFAVLMPIQRQILGDSPEAQAAMVGGMAGGFCGALIGLIYPVAVLIVLTRPAIKEQFTS